MATRSGKSGPKGEGGAPSMEGEFRSGPIAGTALVAGVTWARKGLVYAEVEGMAVFEGDIILGSLEEVRAVADAAGGPRPLESIGITGQQFRWPNATIPYDIDPALPNQQRITDAIAHWEANTRIRFTLRTAANAAQLPDYVHFRPGSGCSSMVGRRGSLQNITLAAGCSTGNAIHEIGHAVGLWHEQSREDRDTFVQIVWANIDPSMQHNFTQHIADGDDLGPYDYGSLMHYPATAFSINGQPTIIALQPMPAGVVMGQRNGLSQGDINGVHTMYPGPTVTLKEVRKDPIIDGTVVTVKEARKDPIRDTQTIKEVRKDPVIDVTVKEVRKDPIRDTVTIKEAGKDPAMDTLAERTVIPGPQPDYGAAATPFALAGPSRVGGAADVLAEVAAQVQELAEALVAVEQQQAELLEAYEAAVQSLEVLQQGQA